MDLFSCLIEEYYLQGYTLIKKFVSKFYVNLVSSDIEEIDVYDFNKVFYLSLPIKNSNDSNKNSYDDELENLFVKNNNEEYEENLHKIKFNQIVLKVIMTMIYNAKYYDNYINIDNTSLDKFINLFKNEDLKAENKEDFNDEKNEEIKKNPKDIQDLLSQLGIKKGLKNLLEFFDIGMDKDEFTFKNEVKEFVGYILNQKNSSGEVNRQNINDDNNNENYSYSNAFLKRIKMYKLEKINDSFLTIYQTQIKNLIDKYFTYKKPDDKKENFDEDLDCNENGNVNKNISQYKNNPKLINNQMNNYNNNNYNFKNAQSYGRSDINFNPNNQMQMNNQGYNNINRNNNNNYGFGYNNNNANNNFNNKNPRNQYNILVSNNSNKNNYNYNNYNNNQNIKTVKEINQEKEEKIFEENKQEFLKNYKVKFLTFERGNDDNLGLDDFHDFFFLINNIYKSHNIIDKKLEEIKIKEEKDKKKQTEEEENEGDNNYNNYNNNNNEENLNFDYRKNNNSNINNYNNYNNYSNKDFNQNQYQYQNLNPNSFSYSNSNQNLNLNSEEKIDDSNFLKSLYENEFNFIVYLLPYNNEKSFNNICNHLGRYDYLYNYFINSIWIKQK